jgi:hypothetical protein
MGLLGDDRARIVVTLVLFPPGGVFPLQGLRVCFAMINTQRKTPGPNRFYR